MFAFRATRTIFQSESPAHVIISGLRLFSSTTASSSPSGPKPTKPKRAPRAGKARVELPAANCAVIQSVCEALDLSNSSASRVTKCWQQLHTRNPDAALPSNFEQAHAIITHLTSEVGIPKKDVAHMFTSFPELLQASLEQQVLPATLTLQSLLALKPNQLRQLLVVKPDLLMVAPANLHSTFDYLSGIGLTHKHVSKALMLNPAILTTPLDSLMTNIAFLRGISFTATDVSDMLHTSPKWLTLGLTELTVKWAFFKNQMKGRTVDLVLWPQLLERDLIGTLGPRTGFAKKKRLKLLMPSYCWGHPLLNARQTWRDSMVVPVLWYMTAKPAEMCKVFDFSAEEYARYKRCWILTMGQQWRKQLYGTSMPLAEAYKLFRAGL